MCGLTRKKYENSQWNERPMNQALQQESVVGLGLSQSKAEESEFHQEYVSKSSDTDSDSSSDGGDLASDEGRTRNFVSPNTDLNFSENGKDPVNISGSIPEECEPINFLSLFWMIHSGKT
ncbi:unnamed protein product [Dicrocoelium dendriticum]|nr:unnamed protein product [Dicrocoelium dendriticum]